MNGYIDQRLDEGAHRHTIKKELITLRVALKVARSDNAFRGSLDVLFPQFDPAYEPRRRVLSMLEFESLVAVLPLGRRQMVAVLALTGARRGETYRLTWNDIGEHHVFLRGTKTKDAPREVPLLPELRALLQELPRGEGSERVLRGWMNLYRDLSAACARVGIAPITPNDLRRSFATWLRNAGVDSASVAPLLGHANSKMVEKVYGRINLDAKTRAVAPLQGIRLTPASSPRLTASSEDSMAASAAADTLLPKERVRQMRPNEASKFQEDAARPAGIEPTATGLEGPCS